MLSIRLVRMNLDQEESVSRASRLCTLLLPGVVTGDGGICLPKPQAREPTHRGFADRCVIRSASDLSDPPKEPQRAGNSHPGSAAAPLHHAQESIGRAAGSRRSDGEACWPEPAQLSPASRRWEPSLDHRQGTLPPMVRGHLIPMTKGYSLAILTAEAYLLR